MKKAKIIVGGLVTLLFITHVILMTLLLAGWIPYNPNYKYTGIGLVIIMIVHMILCIFSWNKKQERDQKFYRLKWITGLAILLFLTVHGRDYVHEVRWLCFHFNKGVIAACIETLFLVCVTLHIRINVDAMCNNFGMKDQKKRLICSRISCMIATLLILLPGIAIWSYFI